VNPVLDLLVWVIGQILGADTTDECVYETSTGYELCIGGGNPVPLDLDEDYFPVEGTDVSITIQRKF